MIGAEACAVVAMEVLEEQDQVPPVRIGLEFFRTSVHRAAAIFVAEEDAREAAGKLASDIPEAHLLSGAGRKLELKTLASEIVELLQGLDEQIIQRKPDRPAPVGISAEQPGGRFSRLVVHRILVAIDLQPVRLMQVITRERADSE